MLNASIRQFRPSFLSLAELPPMAFDWLTKSLLKLTTGSFILALFQLPDWVLSVQSQIKFLLVTIKWDRFGFKTVEWFGYAELCGTRCVVVYFWIKQKNWLNDNLWKFLRLNVLFHLKLWQSPWLRRLQIKSVSFSRLITKLWLEQIDRDSRKLSGLVGFLPISLFFANISGCYYVIYELR